MTALAAALSLLPALAGPPSLAPADEVRLAAREVVMLASDTDGQAVGVIDVSAHPDRVFAAAIDLEARVGEIDGLSAIETYDARPDHVAARWTVAKLGIEVRFHVVYEIDSAARRCTFHLDPERKNEIDATAGSYEVFEIPGGSRLVYRNQSALPGWIPSALRRRLDSTSARELLQGIRRRAEGG